MLKATKSSSRNGKSCKRARNAVYESAELLACSPTCYFHQFAIDSHATSGSLWRSSIVWGEGNAHTGEDDNTWRDGDVGSDYCAGTTDTNKLPFSRDRTSCHYACAGIGKPSEHRLPHISGGDQHFLPLHLATLRCHNRQYNRDREDAKHPHY